MKINNLSLIGQQKNIYQNKSLKSLIEGKKEVDVLSYLASSPSSLSFQSTRRVPLKQLKFNDATTEALISKIRSRILSSKSGTEFPVRMFESNGEKFAYYINKKENNETEVIIKNLIDNIDEWKKVKNNQSELKFTVDKEGLLETATLSKKINENFTRIFRYKKESPIKSSVKINEGIVLRQSRSDENIWNTRPDLSKCRMDKSYDISKDFKDVALADLFFEMAKRHASLLA